MNNPFDFESPTKEELEKIKSEMQEEYNKRDYLIHKVFAQNEDGKELLKMWLNNTIITKPVAIKGQSNLLDIGITQGMQDFVRGIYLTCEKVEKGNN